LSVEVLSTNASARRFLRQHRGPLSSVFDFGQSTPQNGSVVLLDDTTGEVTSVK
jgi:hypothetical protein